MPYFVYKIHPDKTLDPVDTFDVFKDAMALCRQMRREMPEGESYQVRMIFAKDPQEARRLLTTKRAASPVEEWEV
jgi:hypothetical protein